jgi:hypothetical protein
MRGLWSGGLSRGLISRPVVGAAFQQIRQFCRKKTDFELYHMCLNDNFCIKYSTIGVR